MASWVVEIYTWSITWNIFDLKLPPPFQLLFGRNLNFPNFWGIQSQISYPIAEKFSTFCSKSLKRLNKQWSRVVRIALELAIKNSANACRSRNICAYRMVKKLCMVKNTDYGRPVGKSPSLHDRKSTPTPKFLGLVEAYFACHIGPNFQISLINALIGCP